MTDNNKGDSAPKNEINPKEEDLTIDFSEIKKKLSGFFKSKEKAHHEAHHQTPSHQEEELSLDFSGAKTFFKNNARWIIPLTCILIAIFVSVYLRTMPQRMPITDDWAQNTV
ncbi:MAG: hypothetical protein AABX04_07855, partial [Nanoarchaeota archaeon]